MEGSVEGQCTEGPNFRVVSSRVMGLGLPSKVGIVAIEFENTLGQATWMEGVTGIVGAGAGVREEVRVGAVVAVRVATGALFF